MKKTKQERERERERESRNMKVYEAKGEEREGGKRRKRRKGDEGKRRWRERLRIRRGPFFGVPPGRVDSATQPDPWALVCETNWTGGCSGQVDMAPTSQMRVSGFDTRPSHILTLSLRRRPDLNVHVVCLVRVTCGFVLTDKV